MQSLVCEKRTMIVELTKDAKADARQSKKQLTSAISLKDKSLDRAKKRDEKAKWWKTKYEELVKELGDEASCTDELREQLIEWKNIAADMRNQYESMSDPVQPMPTRKVWVKILGKVRLNWFVVFYI